MSVVNRKNSRRVWLMSDWLLGAGSYRSPDKRDMTAADPAAMHSQAGLSGRKLHLSSVISPRKLKDSTSRSCYCYCCRYCRHFPSVAGLARWDLHVKQSISSRLTQLGSDSEPFYAFLGNAVMVSNRRVKTGSWISWWVRATFIIAGKQ